MILVTGAAGNIGSELVAALAEAGQPVRALTRSAEPDRFPPGAEAGAGDLNDPASLRPVLAGADGVFLLGQVRAAVTDPADIAAVAARALTAPGHEDRVYELSGPDSLTAADRVAILGQALGRDLRFERRPTRRRGRR